MSAPTEPAPKRRAVITMREEETLSEGANAYSQSLDSNARKMEALKKNPLVPAGAIATGMVLLAGLFAFKTGNPVLSQRLMRARVLAQGATLSVLAVSVAGNVVAGKADYRRAEEERGIYRR